MANFKLSQDHIEDAMNVIVQFMRDSGYDGSLEEGTGLNDVVVRPNSILRELFAQTVDKAAAYQSLQKAFELRDEIGDDEYDAAVDAILSNWFVTRNEGKPSTGFVRMWFLKPLDFMHFRDGMALGTIDSESVVADGEQVFTEENFSYILNTAENQNEYYIDVAVRTRDNSDVEPTTSSSVGILYNDIYFLRTTIPGTFTPGVVVESSEDFIRRTEQAITTRELITARAINTVILDEFSDVSRLYVARHGSSEQLRDIVEFQNVCVHVGNKADIYIASDLTKQVLDVVADENGNISLEQLPSSASVIAYVKAESNGAEIPLYIDCDEKTWCASNVKPISIKVDPQYAGKVSLTLLTDTVVTAVHNFVNSAEQRVACYDPLVKHMFPLIISVSVDIELVDKTIDSTEEIKKAILNYLKGLVVNSEPLVASEIVSAIHVNSSNVKRVKLPLTISGKIFDPKTKAVHQFDIANKFTIGEDYTQYRSAQVTENTIQYYSDLDLITVEFN